MTESTPEEPMPEHANESVAAPAVTAESTSAPAAAAAPFENLTFSISKPRWGASSLILMPDSPTAYSLRLKHVRDAISTCDDVREYGTQEAISLDRWIRALGFYDQSVSSEPVPDAGTWSLSVVTNDGTEIAHHGTSYPEAFPDLLSTMIGLGLPGFEGTDARAFLDDFTTPVPTRTAQPASAPTFAPGAAIPDMAELQEAFAQMMADPAKAEAALRQQLAQLPLEQKTQMLEYVRQIDPAHYEFWRRLLLG